MTTRTGRWERLFRRSLLLDEYLEQWFDLCEQRGLRSATIASYRATALRNTGALGSRRLSAITTGDLDGLYLHLLRAGRKDGLGGLSARTVRYFHSILSRALNDAVAAGVIHANPAPAAHPPSPKAAKARVFETWTPTELATFLRAARSSRLYPAYHVAAMTGVGRGELLGLRWCDVDVAGANLHIVQTVRRCSSSESSSCDHSIVALSVC